jgi:hypothetical protein
MGETTNPIVKLFNFHSLIERDRPVNRTNQEAMNQPPKPNQANRDKRSDSVPVFSYYFQKNDLI